MERLFKTDTLANANMVSVKGGGGSQEKTPQEDPSRLLLLTSQGVRELGTTVRRINEGAGGSRIREDPSSSLLVMSDSEQTVQ